MKILAVNGSHRKGKNTSELLKLVLHEAESQGATTELVKLASLNIKICSACNKCLRKSQCSITDDGMSILEGKLLEADAIELGSPVYSSNVTTSMKNFIDRTRYMSMTKNMLGGKVGAAVSLAGNRYGGQETTLRMREHFFKVHGMYLANARDSEEENVMASLVAGYKDNQVQWVKKAIDDEMAAPAFKQLGSSLVRAINRKRVRVGTLNIDKTQCV